MQFYNLSLPQSTDFKLHTNSHWAVLKFTMSREKFRLSKSYAHLEESASEHNVKTSSFSRVRGSDLRAKIGELDEGSIFKFHAYLIRLVQNLWFKWN